METEEKYWLKEALTTTVPSLCKLGILALDGHTELIPTVLELLLQETQALVDSYCVVEDKND